MRTLATGLLLLTAATLTAEEPPGREKLAEEAGNHMDAAMKAHGDGKPTEALEQFQKALAVLRQVYPPAKYPDGHPDLAMVTSNVGFILQSMGRFHEAEPYFEQVQAMHAALYPAAKFPAGHARLANSLNNLGYVRLMTGAYEPAREYLDQALAMTQRLYPEKDHPRGHADLVSAFTNIGGLFLEMGRYEEALARFEQALEMSQRLYPEAEFPQGHQQTVTCLGNVGNLQRITRSFSKAVNTFEQALAMAQRLYPPARFPNGHPLLIRSMSDLAITLNELGLFAKGLPHLERAADMVRTLFPAEKYPDGHPDLALILNNLGSSYQRLGRLAEAQAHLEQALTMRKKFYPAARYPRGNELVASSHATLGVLAYNRQAYTEAAEHLGAALAMYQRLYPADRFPRGHPQLAATHRHLGNVKEQVGDVRAALELYQASHAMLTRLAEVQLATAPQADALAELFLQRGVLIEVLAASVNSPGSEGAVYRAAWDTKSAVTRVLERRHANARATGTEHSASLAQLRDVRRQTEVLTHDTRLTPAERDRRLGTLAEERDRLERKLAAAIPDLARWAVRDRLGPDELAKVLPAGCVFVDLYEHAPLKVASWRPTRADTVEFRLTAFVTAPGRPVRRVEIGTSLPIVEAMWAWRRDIEAGRSGDAAATVRRRLWEPLAAALPSDTQTLYIAPHGDLAALPWAAIPGAKPDTVLLEEFAGGMSIVPHGAFLLEQLKFPRGAAAAGSILAVGKVDYGSSPWPALPGTAVELKALAGLGGKLDVLTGTDATAGRVTAALARPRYAAIATHGFFDVEGLTAEWRREDEQRRHWSFQSGQRLSAARNLLGFTGLVLAGGEVLTGLSLVDLPLENLQLVTLSACETSLGGAVPSEGVYGLQRAFHLAGCPNVVASLWNVNDAATAALMAKFYHDLWVNKKPPIEALREAQLMIYRHPERIPALAGERGKPDQAKTVELKIEPRASASADKRTPTKLWAAFVLSGVGK
jgi:CHAT domain-containing protein/tetratricopeptide (TPR) repeat protein